MKYLHSYKVILGPMWEVVGVSFQEFTHSIQQLKEHYLQVQHNCIFFKEASH